MGHIYMIKNKKNGKIYIGQTTRPIHKRLEEHETGQSNGCRAVYNAIKKHGWENFEKDWYECPDDELNKHEKWMVNLMITLSPEGYNLREGGGNYGKMSDDSKQRMSESQLGRKHTEKTKQKMSEAQIGKSKSNDHKNNISEAKQGEKHHMYGKSHTKETKQKMSESHRGEKNPDSKRLYQYDLDGNFINSFTSSGEAGRHFEKDGSFIRRCARDQRKTAYGFKWSYVKI
jgi:group I intron endonuclease